MEITITGRNVDVTDRFRDYATEKSDRIDAIADRAIALEVRLCRHHETHGSTGDDRVELTLIGPGPVVRAEASGVDKYAAYDAALGKLREHIRRAQDRKKLHRGHGNRMTSLREAAAAEFAPVGVVPADGDALRWAETGGEQPESLAPSPDDAAPGEADDYSPVQIRHKSFTAPPMTLDDALYRMELVGHDFYLYVDIESHRPCVVYRRKGWDYGVITVDDRGADAASDQPPISDTVRAAQPAVSLTDA